METRGMDRNLWVWEYPNRSHVYVIAADVARGDGMDYSACHVLDISKEMPVQVAEYKGKISTKDFGDFLNSLWGFEVPKSPPRLENNSHTHNPTEKK